MKNSSIGLVLSLVILISLFAIWRKMKKHNREMGGEAEWQTLN